MNDVRVMIVLALIGVALAGFGYSGTSTFQDVLETPALKSYLAPRTLLNGVTRAGSRFVCVGWRGHIVYSDDQGKSWVQAAVPVSSDLVSVNFPSSRLGWAVGHDGIVLHSLDGGATWARQFDGWAAGQTMVNFYTEHPPQDMPGDGEENRHIIDEIEQLAQEGPDKPFLDVWFDNEKSGFIVGTFNLIFHTDDGGRSWEPWFDRTDNPRRLHFYAIRRIGQDLFICGEQGLVLKLDPEAQRFRACNVPHKGTFFGIAGTPGKVIVFGLRGHAFRSLDGGDNWQRVETQVQAGLTGATLTDGGRLVLVSLEGHVLMNTDEEANFHPVKLERPIPAAAVLALTQDTLLIAGPLGINLQRIK